MGERRTDEQKRADKALTKAIELVNEAYHLGRSQELGMLTDYVVIANYSRIDDEQDEESIVMMHPRNGFLPMRSQIGLIRYAQLRLEAIVTSIHRLGRDEDD